MREKLAKFALVIVSVLVGLIICEFAYRGIFEWREAARLQRPFKFSVYSNSIWEFNAELGYDYHPQTSMDGALIENGVPQLCGTFVTGPLGAPGKGINLAKQREVQFIVLGDSFTAMVQQDETWPDILSSLMEKQSGHAVPILNLARDGYGVLQMFDQAAYLLRAGHHPSAFIISIIGPDLIRARFWRMTLKRNDTSEVFTSTVPSLKVSPETHVPTAFIDPRVTKAWCEALRVSKQSDETANNIDRAFGIKWYEDETFFGLVSRFVISAIGFCMGSRCEDCGLAAIQSTH